MLYMLICFYLFSSSVLSAFSGASIGCMLSKKRGFRRDDAGRDACASLTSTQLNKYSISSCVMHHESKRNFILMHSKMRQESKLVGM